MKRIPPFSAPPHAQKRIQGLDEDWLAVETTALSFLDEPDEVAVCWGADIDFVGASEVEEVLEG